MDEQEWVADTHRLHMELEEWAKRVVEWGMQKQQMHTARNLLRTGAAFLAMCYTMECLLLEGDFRDNGGK